MSHRAPPMPTNPASNWGARDRARKIAEHRPWDGLSGPLFGDLPADHNSPRQDQIDPMLDGTFRPVGLFRPDVQIRLSRRSATR